MQSRPPVGRAGLGVSRAHRWEVKSPVRQEEGINLREDA